MATKKTPALPKGPDSWSMQNIKFCNHEGYFIGDIIITPDAVVVLSKVPVYPGTLIRKPNWGWEITDMHGGYWSPDKGRFVLPRKSLTQL